MGLLGLPGQGLGRAAVERRGNQGRSRTVGSVLLRVGCTELGSPVSEGALKSARSTQTGNRAPELHVGIMGTRERQDLGDGLQPAGLRPGAKVEGVLRPRCSPAVCPSGAPEGGPA